MQSQMNHKEKTLSPFHLKIRDTSRLLHLLKRLCAATDLALENFRVQIAGNRLRI